MIECNDATTEATAEALKRILADADRELRPQFFGFLKDFWYYSYLRQGRLDSLCIPSIQWQQFAGGGSKFGPNRRKAYLAYTAWMQSYQYNGGCLLEVRNHGQFDPKRGEARTYRVNLPMCNGDPWPIIEMNRHAADTVADWPDLMSERHRIRESVGTARQRAARSAPLDGCKGNQIGQVEQTAICATYHALSVAGRNRIELLTAWPDEIGADIVAWPRKGRRPYLVAVVGWGRECKPFDLDPDLDRLLTVGRMAPAASMQYLCLGEPSDSFMEAAAGDEVLVVPTTSRRRTEVADDEHPAEPPAPA